MSELLTHQEYQAIAKSLDFPTTAFINGQFQASKSGQTFASHNPATAELIANVSACNSEDVDHAVLKAREAFDQGHWSKLHPSERKEALIKLAKLIKTTAPQREIKKHPATRSFQAIRMYINSELEQIEKALAASLSVLAENGRLVVISFHSLEDRLVKQFMKKHSQGKKVPRGLPISEEELNKGKKLALVGRKLKPSKSEVEENVRSRSSVLRIAKRLPHTVD